MKSLLFLALSVLLFFPSCHKNSDEQALCKLATTPYSFSQGGAMVQLPTAFTPNGDGRNDLFRIVGGSGISTFGLAVFDHDGSILFQTTDPFQGWNGTRSNGSLVSTGTYSVQLKFTTINGDQADRQMCVALLGNGGAGCISKLNFGDVYYFEDELDPSQPGHYYSTGESICP